MILWIKGRGKKGQVAPFMVLLVAILLLAIAATTIIGEVAFSRIRLGNIADAALISASSAFCRTLNQIRQISIGGGGLLVTYVGLQAFLLAGTPWPYKGAPLATGFFINSMLTSQRLFEQAERIAKDAPKNFRMGLYEQVFGGALIDEPKPFIEIAGNARSDPPKNPDGSYMDCEIDPTGAMPSSDCNEIQRDPTNDKVIFINYNKYLNRDSNFTRLWRKHKKAHPLGERTSDDPAWYWKNAYSYYFNKIKVQEGDTPPTGYVGVIGPTTPLGQTTGVLIQEGDTPPTGYDAYLKMQFQNMPTSVSVSRQWMIMIYWYVNPKPPPPMLPAFVPHPWAWIRKITITPDPDFRLLAEKLSSFSKIPFFPRSNLKAEHKTRIRVRGSVWSGYEFRMEGWTP